MGFIEAQIFPNPYNMKYGAMSKTPIELLHILGINLIISLRIFYSTRTVFKRRYNSNDITKELLLRGVITEVHIVDGIITKAVFSCPYTETKNLVVVIGFWFRKFPCLYCLTAYINFKSGYGIYGRKEKKGDKK